MSKRNIQIHFRVTLEESNMIRLKMKELGIKNLGSYLRKMSLDGYCVQLDLSEIREVVRLSRINSNNLNQYAKKANQTGSIYQTDIQDLQRQQA